jgi:hypothetical protein
MEDITHGPWTVDAAGLNEAVQRIYHQNVAAAEKQVRSLLHQSHPHVTHQPNTLLRILSTLS